MIRTSTQTGVTRVIAAGALLIALCPLLVAADTKAPSDPLAGAFFPPEMVLLAHDQIALTAQQQEAIRDRMEKTSHRSDELRTKLEHETAALGTLAKQERVDEAALVGQLDKVLDVERDLKHLHIGLVVAIKNLLTPEQQVKLREISKDNGAQLTEETRKRLTKKVELVDQGAHQWAANGRDPSAILKAMEERFKPLIDSGKVLEAEAVLDHLLERLKPETK